MTRILLVTGATGSQGGATLRELLRRKGDWDLRALVRNLVADKAQALARQGVALVKGDLDDDGSLRAALRGVHGVYSVQTPMGQGHEGEERQGKRLATLAAEAGVGHFVYSSVGGAERNSGVPHFESKWRIEEHIRALGLPATVLRPVVFMDNFGSLMFRTLMLSMFRRDVDRRRPLQILDTADVGWFAAGAFDRPQDWIGREIEIAGDEMTLPEMVRTLRQSGKRPALPLPLPSPLVRECLRTSPSWSSGLDGRASGRTSRCCAPCTRGCAGLPTGLLRVEALDPRPSRRVWTETIRLELFVVG